MSAILERSPIEANHPFSAPESGLVSQLDHLVTELQALAALPGLERTFAIGELVLGTLFHGDVEAWRNRRRNKSRSIRQLAARAGCPCSRSTLNDAVAVYVVLASAPELRTFTFVGPSHVIALLGVPPAERSRLLIAAETQRVSVRALRRRVAELMTQRSEQDERPSHMRELRPAETAAETDVTTPESE